METVQIGILIIDPDRFLVYRNGLGISLTKTEFRILYLLMSTRGKVHSREQISEYVWGKKNLDFPRTIDVHISNIRKKIGRVNEKEVITVLKGVGYKFNDSELN
ncbi:MAG: winged helix-turn-helix domain-containing protein [Bacteroidota bacterium]|nr:winged helix-turn-helix domain-containing protein [Bacteroidota bacterium]